MSSVRKSNSAFAIGSIVDGSEVCLEFDRVAGGVSKIEVKIACAATVSRKIIVRARK